MNTAYHADIYGKWNVC